MNRLFLYLAMFFVLTSLVSAATVHGSVYDLSLEKVSDVRMSVNSAPAQTLISKDGAYSFELPSGEYILKAEYYENRILISTAEESVKIGSDGNYVIDLVLFPVLEEEIDDVEVPDELNGDSYWYYYAPLIIFVLVLIYLRYRKLQIRKLKIMKLEEARHVAHIKPSVAVDPELEKLLDFIKSNEGRVTQKDVRKAYPSLSEAKISLMVAELEHKGIVNKIKKGRGNLIWLRKH
ncbi:MAG: hypothetical protein WC471_01655 [Candidatus Woesearchaeota archaeon]